MRRSEAPPTLLGDGSRRGSRRRYESPDTVTTRIPPRRVAGVSARLWRGATAARRLGAQQGGVPPRRAAGDATAQSVAARAAPPRRRANAPCASRLWRSPDPLMSPSNGMPWQALSDSYRGSARTIRGLTGRWATDPYYHGKVVRHANAILAII